MFDNPRVRGLYASLSDGWTYLNAQSNPQVPERVSAAVSRAFRVAHLQEPVEAADGSHSRRQQPGRRIGESFDHAARVAVADLVGARPEFVVMGPSRAALLDRLAHTMGRKLRLGQEVVLSRVDDPANITPWTTAADLFGATVRWAEPDLATGALPAWQFAELVGQDTAVVAVGAANRYVGAVNDIRGITDVVRKKTPRAVTVVDVDNIAPYCVVDLADLGADVLAVDIGSLGGPQVGALVFRDAQVMAALAPFGGRSVRSVLEFGGVSEGLLGGVPEAVEHLAALDDAAQGTRRRRLRSAIPQASAYTRGLARRAVEGLQSLGTVHVVGVDGDFHEEPAFDNVERVPRVTFMVEGVPAETVQQRLVEHGVVADVVRQSQSELLRVMGVFGDPDVDEAAGGFGAVGGFGAGAGGGRRSRGARGAKHARRFGAGTSAGSGGAGFAGGGSGAAGGAGFAGAGSGVAGFAGAGAGGAGGASGAGFAGAGAGGAGGASGAGFAGAGAGGAFVGAGFAGAGSGGAGDAFVGAGASGQVFSTELASVGDGYVGAVFGHEYADPAGAVVLSFAPHNTAFDVDQVIRAVASLR